MEMISLLYPQGYTDSFTEMSEVTAHDLGLVTICQAVTAKELEQNMLLKILMKMSADPAVTQYRCDIFEDIYASPAMCDKLMKLLDKVNFLRDYGSFKKKYDDSESIWELLHRLEEIHDYIGYVEAIHDCLADASLTSQGLIDLKAYVANIYSDNGFAELKKDIEDMRATTADLRSVTVGINLNNRFEAESIGLISVNSKPFTKSNMLGNFHDKLATKNGIKDTSDWDENYRYHPFDQQSAASGAIEKMATMSLLSQNSISALTVGSIPMGDAAQNITHYMDRVTNHMLSIIVKKLRERLSEYVAISVTDIANLIPEFVYYIRFADYIRSLKAQGFHFCKPLALDKPGYMDAQGIYNMKLACASGLSSSDIITNDLIFDNDHLVYILTGANRGGKTTITQAIGLLYALAQGGIEVPGDSFQFHPVDCIYTHFPADEDKTMDLGRLGEECKRFREIYLAATSNSLLLLNESFSTTSFEEGYYIAKDSIRAILQKQIRTIYNTHMHKLGFDVEELDQAVSLIVKNEGENRSFKVALAPPEGTSYARDIAVKYGVTYEMLTQ